MTSSEKILARKLLYLPLDLSEKVLLWLAFRCLKQVSEITVMRRLRNNNENNSNIKKVKKWIKDAGLFYANDGKNLTSWHVGKDKNKAIVSAKILHRFDYQSEYQSGIYFGFPEKSVEAYAHNRNVKLGEDQIPMIWPGLVYLDPYLKDKDCTPYFFYAIRADREKEDSKTANLWAETIRKDLPLLAKWFEKAENIRRKKETESEERQKMLLKRNSQKIKEIFEEYSKEENTTKGIFLKSLQEFNESIISEFQFSSICYFLRKKTNLISKETKNINSIMKLGESLYSVNNQKPKVRIKKFNKIKEWSLKNKKL